MKSPDQHSVHGRGISASDLVASFMNKNVANQPEPAKTIPNTSSAEPQDFLLQLLNRSKPAQGQAEPNPAKSRKDTKSPSPARVFGEDSPSSPFAPEVSSSKQPRQESAKKEGIFTYVNPFEQLAASSPRNRTPMAHSGRASPAVELLKGKHEATNGSQKRGADPSPAASTPRKKMTPSLPSTPALKPVDAPVTHESVSESLHDVAQQVDQEADAALAKAVEAESKEENGADELAQQLQEVAIDVKDELDKDGNQEALEEDLSKPVAEAVKDIINDAAKDNVVDSWESADDSPVKDAGDRTVRVFNFPMKPFVSIHIKPSVDTPLSFRENGIMDIARLKKEFDQLDRSLAAASPEYIVYALARSSGGMRVIRQEDGKDRQLFKSNNDRIFNVSLATQALSSGYNDTQAVIGTGVSGAVYWSPVTKAGIDHFDADTMENESLIFPPLPASEDQTSGSQLKTRVRKSSRHPEFFAIGRGKSINIVWPSAAATPVFHIHKDNRTVDTERYLADRCLKVNTGKSGKDFVFSEDDSVIASLDKAGRLRFWDIRELVEIDPKKVKEPIHVKTALLSFATSAPSDKSWPTSVLFVDKIRPYTKATALRYMIVGLKQNHTLQLWDIALGKAVQELHFPHQDEADPICSVAYHPNSGIIVLAHPTRNSIYFVHLSAPRYNLPTMSQAKYIQRLAQKDATLPATESTAIMSGLREISFASKGHIRSVELLPARANYDPEEPPLFELYVMHSKGVTCLSISKDDLGWNSESKVIHPVDAEKAGLVDISALRDPAQYEGDVTASEKETPRPKPSQIAKKAAPAPKETPATPVQPKAEIRQSVPQAAEPALTEKAEKKKKRKEKRSEEEARASEKPTEALAAQPPSAQTPTSTYAQTVQRSRSPQPERPTITREASSQLAKKVSDQSQPIIDAKPSAVDTSSMTQDYNKMAKGITGDISKSLNHELENLYRRFDEDRRVQDAASSAKQDAILRLISSTLSENVNKNLTHIITTSIQQSVLPSITSTTATTLDRRLTEILTQQLHQSIPRELSCILPDAIGHAIQNPDVLRVISDLVANKVAAHVETEFSSVLHSNITPAFKNLALNAANKMSSELEKRVAGQLKAAEQQHVGDSMKIDQLTSLVRGLSQTVQTMAEAQSEFQSQFLKVQKQLASLQQQRDEEGSVASRQLREASASVSERAVGPVKSPEEIELDEINSLMMAGNYEDGAVKV